MPAATHAIEELDRLPEAAFVEATAPLFEGAPRFLARLAEARPFGSFEVMFARAGEIARSMPRDEQVELVDAHPRLGAPRDSVSALSFDEQGYRHDAAADAPAGAPLGRVDAELAELNAAYEARFGFRYCVFVAGRALADLIPDFRAALNRDPDRELQRALDDVVAIAAARLAALPPEVPAR